MKNLNKGVKLNKKILFIIALLVIIITTVSASIVNVINKKGISSNNTRMQFSEISEDDYNTQSDNVKFMAYFLHDNKKVDGTSNRIGYSDTMYFDLTLEDGTLENPKIEIGSQNFYLETNLMSDSVISENYVSKNTKEIILNNLRGNIQKTFEASVKSGDYEFTTSIADAIGNDISNYSKKNTIKFTADYTDSSGAKTEISKEVPLIITWYGEVNCEIPEKVYGSDNLIQKYNVSDYLDTENNEMTIEFNIATQETENEIILNKSYVEGTIPLINEIAPTNVAIEGEKVEYTYDKDTRKFSASRTADIEENMISEQAYSGIYAQSEINYRYNEYKVKATYPIDAYLTDDDEYINIDIPITAHYEGVNGERSNDNTNTINVSYSNMENTETGFNVSVGRNVLYPEERQIVSKHNVLLGYRYNNSNTNLWQSYYTKWNIVTNQEETAKNVVLTDNTVEDKFVASDETEIKNNGYITNEGIAFTNPVSALGLAGWIKVYDDETDELLHTFTSDDWSDYDMLNPYEYDKDVKYIRIETSEVSENSFVTIYNIKKINTEKMVEAFSKTEVENMKFIETSFNGQMQVDGKEKTLQTTSRANFEEEISVVNFNASEGIINTQGSNNIQLEIAPNITQFNTCKWENEQYLIKFPSDIIDVSINDLRINNADGVSINDYYKYTEEGYTYIKIEMNGKTNSNYQLLLDCFVQTNPNAESKKANIELYAYNNENNSFYESEISKDIYDINNNANTEESIGKKTDIINIVRPETLLSNESITINGEKIYNPLVAMIENSDRTATIDIELQNNHKNAITDIKLLGKIPYEGNTYQQNGEDLGSTYTSKIISEGINLPSELAKRATIYYSEQDNVTDDPSDEGSKWVQNIDDYSNVKNFLILFNSYQIESNEQLKISYDIKIPDDAAYNEIAYSTHTIYYSEHNETEVERKSEDITKLGFNIARRFKFELTKYSREDNKPIKGVSFRITEIGNRLNSIVVETGDDGKINIPNLLLEKDYTIQEIGVPDDYIIDSNVIKFRAYELDGELKVNILGNFEEEPIIDQEKELISATLYNEVKYDLDITNINNSNEGITSTFTLEGRGETQEAITNNDGKLIFEGLYPEEEYTLRQTSSKGYYINEAKEIVFKVSRGENGLEIVEDTSGLLSLKTESEKIKPTVNITINSEKIPTYNLKVVLYENETIIPLEKADYTITGSGKEVGENYTTDAKGSFTIKDLYAYVEGKNETAEYTLKQTNPATGYALSQEPIKFVVTKNTDTQELMLSIKEGTIREDYTIENDTVTISLDARKLFNITTIDGESVNLLPGVKVVIKESVIVDNQEEYIDPTDEYGNVLGQEEIINGEPCRVFITDENGEIKEPLKDGIYKLVKVEVPEGYELEENEEDRTYYVGIGETRGAEVETSFRDPLLMDNAMSREPEQYVVTGREDGKAMYYHNGEISIINDENKIEKTIKSEQVYQIVSRQDGFDVLTDSSIIKYNDNLDVVNTFNITNGMRYFARNTDGSYVISGNFEGEKTISGSNTVSGSSISIDSVSTGSWFWQTNTVDIFVMKVNSSGKVEALVNVGGTGEDIPTYIDILNNGDYLVSSHMTSGSIEANMTTSGSAISGTFTDSFFIMNKDTMKVSKIISVKTSRGNGNSTDGNLHRTFQGQDEAIYYTGQLTGSVTFNDNETVSGKAITVTSTGSSDAYIVKYNNDGKVVWAINVGGVGTDHLYSAEITTDGGILLGGDSENGKITVSGDKTSSGMDILTEPISNNAGTWRGIAIKVDDEGRVVWANEFGYSTDEGCYAVSGFTENSYALCGFETYSSGTPVFIRVDEAVKKSEISEVEGIEIPSIKKRYNITTSVNGVGGTITGQDNEVLETVIHGEDSVKEIVITPNEGYEILSIIINGEKINFTPDEDGTVTLDKFKNVTENMSVVAEFSNNTSKVIVHHYLLGTEDTKIAEDDVLVGIVGTEYTTAPKMGVVGYNLATNEDNSYIIIGNPSGTYGEYDQEVIYYYTEQDVKVTVNHYIEGTTTPLSDTIVTKYEKGQTYTTNVADDIPEEYELVKMPSNATGVIEESEIVVTYYYRLKPTYKYSIEYYFDGELDSSLTETGETIEGKVIDSYEDKVKDGYVFEKTENYPLTISTNEENNTIKVYYKAREDLSYKIEYYYDGIINDENTITVDNVKFGTVISEFTNKVIEGYQFEKTENYPLTISTNNETNVIKVFYTVRKDLYYTVNYYEKGTENKLAESKEVGGNIYNAVITEEAIDIEGYNKVSDGAQSIVIGVNEEENVINFYYTKRDDLSYNVKYLEQGTNEELAETKTVENQTFKDSITEEAIDIPGYNAIEPTQKEITIEVNNNEIIFYYQKKTDIKYKVEYYYDGTINDENTEEYTATFKDEITEYEDKNITGYKLEKTENLPLTITENSDNNVIKVYYIKDTFKYTVEYYYDGIINEENTEEYTATYQDIIETYEDKNITGYKLSGTENLPLTITENAENNVIKLYYVKDTFGYTVEYYYDGNKDNTKTETIEATFGDRIENYKDKNITGYRLDKTENLPLTVSENVDNNIIKVYYVKNQFNYSVEYYYDNNIDASKTETIEATFQDVIENYEDKIITGYKLDRIENLPLTITENPDNNVIKVYYIKRTDLSYTVNYYEQNTENKISKSKVVNGVTFNEVITEEPIDIEGYNKVSEDLQQITIGVNNNEINFYYTKRDDLSYTVRYLEQGTDEELAETKTVENQTFKDSITEEAIDIPGYNAIEPTQEEITIEVNNNEIIFYYQKKTDIKYKVEYYYDGTINDENTEEYTATFKDEITEYEDKNITGYKLEKTENLPLTISANEEENIIKVYYIKDTFKYTVEYYYDGEINKENTEEYTSKYQDVIQNYEDKVITGYRLDRTENLPLTITENSDNNVIKIYYVKDTFKYTVEYYYDGEINKENTEEYTATYQDVIKTYEDKNITGYKLERTENLPLTITENSDNNVIKVYYIKDTFKYTVEYYYDGIINEENTEEYTATYQDIIETYEDKNITGYKLSGTENLPLTITENAENNVIKVYYVKDIFGYTVEYYYDGNIDNTKTETIEATYGDLIENYTDKNITGYTLEKTENLPLIVSENAENNVIKIYYVKDKFNYTVEYYYDGIINEDNTEEYTATFQDVIEMYTDKNITGYTLEKTENVPLTITENPDNNVIKVYYVKDQFSYTVEYYYDNVKDESLIETFNATYQDIINNYADKIKDGYKFEKVENLPLTITENPANNVIKVYYIRKDAKVTVKYLEKNTNKVLDESANYEISGKVFDHYETEQKEFTGYNFVESTDNTTGAMTEEPIEVIYYYVLKTPYLTDEEISKNGTVMIENLDDEITYNISYKVNLQDYMGQAQITIIDTLPFAIDTSKSSLDSGEYNDENNTITWVETIDNIYSYENRNNEIEVNKTINVVYLGLVQETTSIENRVTASIKTQTPEKEFEAKEATAITTTGFTIDVPVSKIWDDENNKLGNRPDSVEFKLTGSDGSEYFKTIFRPGMSKGASMQDSNNPNKWNAIFENLPKYDSNRNEIEYTLSEEESTEGDLKYYDTTINQETKEVKNTDKYGKVIVHYYIQNVDGTTTTNRVPDTNGKEIPDVIIEGKEGNPYSVSPAENINSKYELVEEKLPASEGTIEKYNEEKPQELIYYYRLKPAKVIINYIEQDKDAMSLANQELIEGHVDDEYNTNTGYRKETISKDGKTYTLVEDSKNTEGIMTVEDINVTYYYLQNTKATVRYVERNPENGEIVKDLETPRTEEGLVGDEFVTNEKAFIGYRLVESPENRTIKMTKEEQTLIYYYEAVYTGLVENHIDEKTGNVLYTKTHQIQVGQNYEISSKKFEGYDLVENKLPENSEGIMGEELITVNYYYIKKAVLEVNYVNVLTKEPLTDKIVDNTKHEGDLYTTEEKIFDGYDLVEVPDNSTGTMKVQTDADGNIVNNKTVVTYYYAQKAQVEEHHIDILTNDEIEEPTIHNGHVGDKYNIPSKEFLSYAVVMQDKDGNNMLPTNSSGEMTKEKIIVTYYYNQPAKVIAHYIDRTTGKELEETDDEGKLVPSQMIIEGQKDDEYKTEEKEFLYYNLVEKPLEKQGKMKVEITKDENGKDIVNNLIDVYYYYEPKTFNIGVEKEISKIKVNDKSQNLGNNKLAKIEIYRKNIDDTKVEVEYTIKVKNTGEIDGTATIKEDIPEGMSLVSNDGTWEEKDGYLSKVIPNIKAGETKEYKVILSWNKGNKNLGEKENTVQIVSTGNVPGFKEQNIDDNSSEAKILINVSTGSVPWPLVIALIAIAGLEGVTLSYAKVLTNKQKKNRK